MQIHAKFSLGPLCEKSLLTKQIALRDCVGRLKGPFGVLTSQASPNAPGGIVVIIVIVGEAVFYHSCLKVESIIAQIHSVAPAVIVG
jgi:hypothetical protein